MDSGDDSSDDGEFPSKEVVEACNVTGSYGIHDDEDEGKNAEDEGKKEAEDEGEKEAEDTHVECGTSLALAKLTKQQRMMRFKVEEIIQSMQGVQSHVDGGV